MGISMVSYKSGQSEVRIRALHNFLKNNPKPIYAGFIAETEEGSGERPSACLVDGGEAINNIIAEVDRMRDRLMHTLMHKHGLQVDQVKNLTLNDIDLAGGKIAIRSTHEDDICSFIIDDRSVRDLADYLRVRPPTKSSALFPRQDEFEGIEGLVCGWDQQEYSGACSESANRTPYRSAGKSSLD